jgi:hypothetical protein
LRMSRRGSLRSDVWWRTVELMRASGVGRLVRCPGGAHLTRTMHAERTVRFLRVFPKGKLRLAPDKSIQRGMRIALCCRRHSIGFGI